MIFKGIVVEIYEDYAVVMNDDFSYRKINLKDNLKIGSNIMYTDSDIYRKRRSREFIMRKKLLYLVPVIALALVIWGSSGSGINPEEMIGQETITVEEETNAVSLVAVDINPSFEIMLDENNLVIEVIAKNTDAEQIDVSDLPGTTLEHTLRALVNRAGNQGFIDTEDLDEDFVLVTTVDADEDDDIDMTDLLQTIILNAAKNEAEMNKVNVAVAQATMTQLRNAENQNTYAGLHAENYGDCESLQEYFRNGENYQNFMQHGTMVQNSFEYQMELMQGYINQMGSENGNKSDMDAALNQYKNEYFEVKEMYNQAMNQENIQEAQQYQEKMQYCRDEIQNLGEALKKQLMGEDMGNHDDTKGNGEQQAGPSEDQTDNKQREPENSKDEAGKKAGQ